MPIQGVTAGLWLGSHSYNGSQCGQHTTATIARRSEDSRRRQRASRSENVRKKMPREGFSAPHHIFRSPLRHETASPLAPFRPEIDDVIRRLDNVEVVLDDHDRIAVIHELVQDVEQLVSVIEVQPGRWLVEDVKSAAGPAARELLGELHALRLATAQSGRRLPQLDVPEPDILKRPQFVGNRREVFEERQRLIDGQVQDVGD
jgi:hypothetical protein